MATKYTEKQVLEMSPEEYAKLIWAVGGYIYYTPKRPLPPDPYAGGN